MEETRNELLRAIQATCRRITESNNGYGYAQDASAVQALVEALRALPAALSPVECIDALRGFCGRLADCADCPIRDWCTTYLRADVIPSQWGEGGGQA